MKWLFAILAILREWLAVNTARKIRRAMSAEAKLQREREKLLRVAELESRGVVEHGKRMLEHSEAVKRAKAKVKEIEGRLKLWETKSPPP